MRSWRRGIKEMDLILGGFADHGLAHLNTDELAVYENLLSENDHDLYAWCAGQVTPPDVYRRLIEKIMLNYKDL